MRLPLDVNGISSYTVNVCLSSPPPLLHLIIVCVWGGGVSNFGGV
jgi:hypothetical protein